jgi:hypothetical protein
VVGVHRAVATHQTLDLLTPEGKKFLRRVARRKQGEDWKAYASEATGWLLHFWRDIDIYGDVGEPDVRVTVETNQLVCLFGKKGTVKAFEDAKEVIVPECRRVHLNAADTATVAKLLLDGWRLTVVHSSGSPHSSEHGLAFVRLTLENRLGNNWDEVQIGGETVYVNGVRVASGACCEGGW